MVSEKHPQDETLSAGTELRHGLLAKTVVLCNENEKDFEALLSLLIERHNPVNGVEMLAIESMASASWSLRRVASMAAAHRRSSGPDESLGAPRDNVTVLLRRYYAGFQKMDDCAFRNLLLVRKMRGPFVPPEESEALTPLPIEPAMRA